MIHPDTWTRRGRQPALDRILGQAGAGDVLTTCAFIDLARSLDHLQHLVHALH